MPPKRLSILSAAAMLFALALGSVAGVSAAADAACYSDRDVTLLKAIDGIAPDSATAWTKAGKPKVAALEMASGLDTNAKERDRVWEDFYTWQETVEAEAQAAEEVALLRQNLVNAKHRANMTAGALDQMTRQRNEQRGMAREASAQARLSMRDLNLVKEKYRAVASGVQPCASYAAALDDSIGWRYAGKDEAKRLVACLRAG